MTRNFLMRSLWGKKKETVSKSTALQHDSKHKWGKENSLNDIRSHAKTHHYWRETELCLHDNLWSWTADTFALSQEENALQRCRWKARAADGLRGSDRMCEKLLMGSWIRLLDVAKSAISPPSLLKVRPQKWSTGGIFCRLARRSWLADDEAALVLASHITRARFK